MNLSVSGIVALPESGRKGRMQVNTVVLIGRSAGDARLRYTQKGQAVATFGVAVSRPGHGDVDFVEVVAFNRLAEVLGHHLRKGRLIGVKGRLKCRHYDDGTQRRKVMEVVAEMVRFLDAPAVPASETTLPDLLPVGNE